VPTYAYLCTECEHHFEIVQSFKDDSLTTCPNCQGRLRKLFNAVGVVFKGSGFYSTDSRKRSSPSESADSPAGTGTTKTATKTTTTTANKTATKSAGSAA